MVAEGLRLFDYATPATEDWYTEYLDLKIGIKVVSGIDEAIRHINKYNSGHSEAVLPPITLLHRNFLTR